MEVSKEKKKHKVKKPPCTPVVFDINAVPKPPTIEDLIAKNEEATTSKNFIAAVDKKDGNLKEVEVVDICDERSVLSDMTLMVKPNSTDKDIKGHCSLNGAALPNSREESDLMEKAQVDIFQQQSIGKISVADSVTVSMTSPVNYPSLNANVTMPLPITPLQTTNITKPLVVPSIYIDEASIGARVGHDESCFIYPRIDNVSAPKRSAFVSEAELLSEGQLLEFYKSEQLDFVDDFIDVFVNEELEPRNCLFELLKNYKKVCDEIEDVVVAKSNSGKALITLNNEVWTIENRKIVQKGKCQCGRSANGSVSYKMASLKAEKLVALNDELLRLNKFELDVGICLEIRARALALQIQWAIIDLNNNFLTEHQLTWTSFPILIPISSTHSLSRIMLKKALSDLFYYIRFPALPTRFHSSVMGWISELGAALVKACTPDDQLFLLSQLLRCPSPLDISVVGLVQTFVDVLRFDQSLSIDNFVAMLSLFLRPTKHREQFMFRVMKYYEGENSWNFVGDDGNSMELSNMSELAESDFVALFSQFSINALFSTALKNFTFMHKGNRLKIILSLISFVLVILKICDEGLKTYSNMRGMSKKICDNMRCLVQCFCNYWDLVRTELTEIDRNLIQNEVNRVLLQAAYYIVSKNSVDLWQFLVDFPYGSVTEYCRLRFQLLFRHSPTMTVRDLYEIPDDELITKIKSSRNLGEQLCDCKGGKVNATYKVLALSSVISFCSLEQSFLVFQIIQLCFLDEATRDDYYKVGSETVALFLEKNSNLLPLLLKHIDRNVDHFYAYAVDILSNASKMLQNCRISVDDVSNVLGKWLINRAIDHPASQIARRVLCSMNWDSIDGSLWLPQAVHDACAETIVKAHIVHCKVQNGMIAKSVTKATKLALKCSDSEQQFSKFCWDVLIKLKITEKPANEPPTINDLAAFYLFIEQSCLQSRTVFFEHGLLLFVDIVNASVFKAVIMILSQVISRFGSALDIFTSNQTFRRCVEQIIHADESAYAIQLIVGVDVFPGPTLSLLGSAIEFQIYAEESVLEKKKLAHAWLDLLTCKKEWNGDKFVIYLIGFIVKAAFYCDSNTFLGIGEKLENVYKSQYLAWKDVSKGIMSWFSTQIHPPIIASNLLTVSPWTSFLMLRAELCSFGAFYESLDASMCKHPSRSLEESIKKAYSKTHIYFTIDRLHFARWLEFLTLEAIMDHEVFPLALQQFCCILLKRKTYERKSYCVGHRLLNSSTMELLVKRFRHTVLPQVEKKTEAPKLKSFYRAVPQWLFNNEVYDPHFNKCSDYILDYFLNMAISGDEHLWIELVDNHELRKSIESNMRIFATCYHLHGLSNMPTSNKIPSLTKFFEMLDHSPKNAVAVPAMPQHNGLPLCEKYEASSYGISPLPLAFSRYLDELNKEAKTFVSGKEAVDSLNSKYINLFQGLYIEKEEILHIVLRCGNFVSSQCPRPATVEMQVKASNYDKKVALSMDENRTKREAEISKLLLMVDSVAINCAQLEHMSSILTNFSGMTVHSAHNDFFKTTGVNLFYKICNFVDGVQFLFPAAVQCYEACLETLGKAFIAENPNEQINLMRIVKAGNLLNHFIVVHFTPHCIAPLLLFQLYTELSHSIRDSNMSEASLALLTRLDIKNSGMPANQFLSLMPIIFQNIAYLSDTSPLRHLCMEHFIHAVFHHFPSNFSTGLKLILSGLDSQAMPPELFTRIISRFDDFSSMINEQYSLKMSQKKTVMTSEQALECLRLISEQLMASRHLLNKHLFSVWVQYITTVCQLAAYFFRLVVYQTFNSGATSAAIEKELRDFFNLLVSVWSSLLEPSDTGLSPWSASDNALAATILESFIAQLNWLPHSVYLPPGSETVETLFWHYFTSKLVNLQRNGTVHVFVIYEAKIARLNWARFWPTLLDLDAMEKVLINGSAELCTLIVEIVVRVPWFQILQQQQLGCQPLEASRAFVSLILSILAHCVHRSTNYAKSRASMESLLKLFLENVKWGHAKMEAIEKIGNFIANNFPADLSLATANNEILKAYFCIWRESCYFSSIVIAQQRISITNSDNVVSNDDNDMNRKRSIYIRTQLALMLRSLMNSEERKKFYYEMLNKTNQLITLDETIKYVCLIRELTAFWTKIPKESEAKAMLLTLVEWLHEHCESPVLLLIANTSATDLSVPVGLHLLDECIASYFQRSLSCNWSEIIRWLNIPKRSKEWLFSIPRSDSDVQPRLFVLNAYLMIEISHSQSANEEYNILRRVADYISSIKPKYISNEAIFLLCVEKWQRLLVRQFSNGIATNVANEALEIYMKWLRRVYVEDRGTSIFTAMAKLTARKPTFPIRFQAFANIMELYLTQQQRSFNQPPRLNADQPVLNSRIHALNELKLQKHYHELLSSEVFVNVSPYFMQSDVHHLGHATALFAMIAHSLYPKDKYLQSIIV